MGDVFCGERGLSGAVFGALTAVVIFSGGCSGGDGTGTTGSKQAVAATATAETNASCIAVAPFYWAIGDTSGTLVSGSVGAGAPVASTVMSIASGSKWLFGAYAVQMMGGTPASMYVPFLNFTSGYVGFNGNPCPSSATVDDCFADLGGMQIEADIGMFDYDGAHLQPRSAAPAPTDSIPGWMRRGRSTVCSRARHLPGRDTPRPCAVA